MREILTIIGFVLVLLLSAALGVPHFVNWSDYKGPFEAQFSRALGRKVTLAGPINLTILPIPSLKMGAIAVTGAPNQTTFSAQNVAIQLAIMPLLQGRFEFTSIHLLRPNLRLAMRDNNSVDLPNLGARGQSVQLVEMKLSDGQVSLVGADGTSKFTLHGVNLGVSAGSLNGPFAGQGDVQSAQGPLHFDFATSAQAVDGLQIKAHVEARGDFPSIEISGVLAGAAYHGMLDVKSVAEITSDKAPIAWEGYGLVAASLRQISAEKYALRVGEGVSALHAEGLSRFEFGAQSLIFARLHAGQLNLDSLLKAKGAPLSGQSATFNIADFIQNLAPEAVLPVALDIGIASSTVIVGGDALSDFSLRLAGKRPDALSLKASLAGPGQSALRMDGVLEVGAGAQFTGALKATSRDVPTLAKWLQGLGSDSARNVANWMKYQPFSNISWQGITSLSPVSLASKDVAVSLDRSNLLGAVAYSTAVGPKPARLYADLVSGRLDLDHLPDMQSVLTQSSALDLALSLDARAVKVARFGKGMVDAGRVQVKVSREGQKSRLQQFDLTDLGGANIHAHGTLDTQGGELSADVDAARLLVSAQLLQKVAPSAWTLALAKLAPALSPLHLKMKLSSDAAARVTGLSLTGRAADSQVSAQVTPSAADISQIIVKAKVSTPESAQMLQQFGFDVLPLVGLGGGDVEFSAQGALGGPLTAKINAHAANGALVFDGTVSPDLAALAVEGQAQFQSSDITPLAQILAMALPTQGASLPVSVAGQIQIHGKAWKLAALKGISEGVSWSGDLASAGAGVSGALHLDHLGLATLASLVFGPPEPMRRGALWPSLSLAPVGLHLPLGQVALSIDHFDLALPLATATDAPVQFMLTSKPDVIGLNGLRVNLRGGSVAGDVTLRRNGREGAASGKLEFEKVGLKLPSLRGAFSGDLDFATSGGSMAAMVSGLAGKGHVQLLSAQVPEANPNALDDVLAQSDRDDFESGAGSVQPLLTKAIAASPLSISDTFAINLAAGQLHLTSENATNPLNFQVDLQSLNLQQNIKILSHSKPKDWPSGMPSVALLFKGPLLAPQRTIEAGAFLADLTAREIMRENQKIAAFKADVRERAAFVRRLRGLRKLEHDDADLKAYEAAQTKLAEQAAALKAALPAIQTPNSFAPSFQTPDADALHDAQKILQQGVFSGPDITKMPLSVPN